MSRIMAHLVAHYPDRERSLAVARGLIRGGVSFLEIQFPFSDPTADGPAIQAACQAALDSGFTVDAGFAFVKDVASEILSSGRDVRIFVMTYASLVFARGARRFLEQGVASGAAGFILPDLPLDYDEGTWDIATELGTTIVPVTVTTVREERLRLLLERKPAFTYVALRRGTTGERTEIGSDNIAFLDRLRSANVKVVAGFGVSDREQVETLDPHVHATVVGSAFVRTVAEHASAEPAQIEQAIAIQAATLCG